MTDNLQSIKQKGVVSLATGEDAANYIECIGKPVDPLYTFCASDEILIITAPAKDEEDFATKYFDLIFK